MIGWLVALVMAGGSLGEPVCAEVWFDLRSMPVNASEAALRARRWGLSERVRKAAGEPAPDILHAVASTVFTARFVGTPEQSAQARCAATIAAEVPQGATARRGRWSSFGPKAGPCGVCAGD